MIFPYFLTTKEQQFLIAGKMAHTFYLGIILLHQIKNLCINSQTKRKSEKESTPPSPNLRPECLQWPRLISLRWYQRMWEGWRRNEHWGQQVSWKPRLYPWVPVWPAHGHRDLVICTFLQAVESRLACELSKLSSPSGSFFSVGQKPNTQQLIHGIWTSNIPPEPCACDVNPLWDTLHRGITSKKLWGQSPVVLTFLFRPLCAVWRNGLISPLPVSGRWSLSVKGKRRWLSLMESWFVAAITPPLTCRWTPFLVSSLSWRKPLDPCPLPEKWEDWGLGNSCIHIK